MKAFQFTSLDETPELVEIPEPTAREGDRVVRVLAAGLNPSDIGLATGPMAAWGLIPRVLGFEGVVELDGRAVYSERAVPP